MNIAAEWRGKNNGDASGGTALSVNLNGRKAPPANTKSFSHFLAD
jgi:hypothetical protein